jgi:RNA polymerase sigma-70 factor (ECF subfamily)
MPSSLVWTLDFPGGAAPRSRGTSEPSWEPTVVREDAVASGAPAPADLADLNESGLVEACVAGQAGAFDIVVERHRRAVYLLCYRFVANHEDASDLSQEVFLRAYRGLRKFKGNASLGTWLHRIAVNVCLNRVSLKKPINEPIDAAQHIDDRGESASERMLRGERAVQVRAAVAQLPKKQRAALILRIYHERSHQEIADILGSSVGAVKANVFHALRNLKKLLPEGSL